MHSPLYMRALAVCALYTGMADALRAKRVEVFEFEYSRKWKVVLQHARPIGPLVAWLASLGYTCFWQSNYGALAQLSAPCFQEDHHHKFGFARSNAVCTHRPDLVRVLKTCQRWPYCR